MAFTAALVAMGLTAAEAASIAAAAGTAAAGAAEVGAGAAAAGGAAGALGAGAAAGAAGAGAGGIGALGAAPVSAIPLAPAVAPAAIGSGAEALAGGASLGTGAGAAGSTPWANAFFAPGGGASNAMSAVKSMGSNMLGDMAPKNTTDYLKLGQMGQSVLGSHPPPAIPPPTMSRPGSAIAMSDPQVNQGRVIQSGGGGGGLDPRTLAILARLMGRR